MKKTITVFLLLIGSLLAQADGVFFSEYIEGSSNNKALEIFNGTDASIDLSDYAVWRYNNGATTGGGHFPLTGTLASQDVFVIANPDANAIILAIADVTADTNWTDGHPTWYNGNDYLGLTYDADGNGVADSSEVVDVIGQLGEDPGSAWDVGVTTEATGEHTLVRKPTVMVGNTDWTAAAGTSADDSEWIVYPQDTFDYLGFHDWSGGGAANIPPQANAGPDQTVNYNETVTMDGSASVDPDGSITAYAWTQISGTTVTLTGANTAIASFTSPASDGDFEFQLSVTDDSSATAMDTVLITVMDISPAALFFSEYIEGSSENKALELFNASDVTLDLADFQLWQVANGGEWPEYTIDLSGTLAPGTAYVVCDEVADQAMLNVADMTVNLYHNGNDAQGLAQKFGDTWMLIDKIGEDGADPGTGWDVAGVTNATKDHTLVRKSTVDTGNTDWAASAGTGTSDSEWNVYDEDDFSHLGTHSMNANAPVVAGVTYSPEFISSANEIEVSADITAVVGTIASAKIWYGTDGNLLNSADMFLESGSTWLGLIPAQSGNIILDFQVQGTDSESNVGESTVQSVLIAGDATEIADIHDDLTGYVDQIVTLQGTVVMGAGVLDDQNNRVYMQDGSGRGLNVFDYDLLPFMDRGDELKVVGTIGTYYTTVQITDFNYTRLSTGNALPAAQEVTISQANTADYEGTFIGYSGTITDRWDAGGGDNIKVASGTDTTLVRLWHTTGIDTSQFEIGDDWYFAGVGSQFSDNSQLLVGYQDDITNLAVDEEGFAQSTEFGLRPAYPNPFNPATRLSWYLDAAGDYELAVYNIIGQQVASLAGGFTQAGYQTVTWNAGNLSSGVYFVRLTAGEQVDVQKIMLLK